MTFTKKVLTIDPVIGMQSLIGVLGVPPVVHGNYFYFLDQQVGRCWNMWAENLVALCRSGVIDKLEVTVYSWLVDHAGKEVRLYGCIVTDKRVPHEYLIPNVYTVGGPSPSTEIAADIYQSIGDPNNELEYFTDPRSYYTKRGYVVSEDGTFVKGKITAPPRPLDGWTITQLPPKESTK